MYVWLFPHIPLLSMCLSSNPLEQLCNRKLNHCFLDDLSQACLAPNWLSYSREGRTMRVVVSETVVVEFQSS